MRTSRRRQGAKTTPATSPQETIFSESCCLLASRHAVTLYQRKLRHVVKPYGLLGVSGASTIR